MKVLVSFPTGDAISKGLEKHPYKIIDQDPTWESYVVVYAVEDTFTLLLKAFEGVEFYFDITKEELTNLIDDYVGCWEKVYAQSEDGKAKANSVKNNLTKFLEVIEK